MVFFRNTVVIGLVSVCVFGGCSSNDSRQASNDSAANVPGAGSDFNTRFSFAQVREQNGELQAARKIYRELLETDPNHAPSHHRLGIIENLSGKSEAGFEHLRYAVAADPDNPEILNDLGYACLMVGKYEQSQQVLITALEIDPRNERAINNLALAFGYSGELDKAFQTFQKVMSEEDALSNLGYVAAQIGRVDFAIECYSQALTINPKMTEAGEALAQLADLDETIKRRRRIAEVSRKTSTDTRQIVNTEHESQDSATTGIRQVVSEESAEK